METRHVYDALDNKVIGGEIPAMELPYDGQVQVVGIVMIRGGKLLGNKHPQSAC